MCTGALSSEPVCSGEVWHCTRLPSGAVAALHAATAPAQRTARCTSPARPSSSLLDMSWWERIDSTLHCRPALACTALYPTLLHCSVTLCSVTLCSVKLCTESLGKLDWLSAAGQQFSGAVGSAAVCRVQCAVFSIQCAVCSV